jgi:DNA-directed RNA polymerase specialized sigma24 family protein
MNKLDFAEEMNLFNKTWRADRRRYLAAGMGETEIAAMYDLHREQFNSDRRHRKHAQSLDGMVFADGAAADESQSPLLEKYMDRFSVSQPGISDWGRYEWIEDLETPELAIYLKSLPETSLELLTSMVVDGVSRADLSREMGVSRAAVTKRMNPVKKVLENMTRKG